MARTRIGSGPNFDQWPFHEIDLQLITGAAEVGKDLYLLGSFGGFGGCLSHVCIDEAQARQTAKEWNENPEHRSHLSVYKLELKLVDEMIPESKP